MTARPSMFMVIMAALAFGWASSAGATGGATAAQKCEAAKLKASGNKAKCLLEAEARSVKSGNPPNTARCVKNFEAAFAAVENRWGQDCPTLGDVNDVEVLIDAFRDDVAMALSGSPPATCPCAGDTVGDISWGPVFATGTCTVFSNGPVIESSGATGRLESLTFGFGSQCATVAGESCGIDCIIRDISSTESAACNASLRAIAAEDGVTCNPVQ